MAAVVASIRVGGPRLVADREPWTTAFHKQVVDGAVRLGRTNLDGDRQADLTVHGGPDKAVCVYSLEHYDAWRRELGVEGSGPGWFGENVTVAGQSEGTVCLGDIYRVGTALVEVSQPRGPCWKLGKRWNRLDMPKLVIRAGRTGWYLRVLEEGIIEAGQSLDLEARPFPAWTIARINHLTYARGHEARTLAAERAALAACRTLAESWRRDVRDGDSEI